MVDAGDSTRGSGGPSPAEGAPTLVEVNTRWHLTDFAPLTDACIGYNAVEETLAAYLDPGRFDALPRVPPTGKGSRYGRVVHLVSYVEGPLERVLHEEVLCAPALYILWWLCTRSCDVTIQPSELRAKGAQLSSLERNPSHEQRTIRSLGVRFAIVRKTPSFYFPALSYDFCGGFACNLATLDFLGAARVLTLTRLIDTGPGGRIL